MLRSWRSGVAKGREIQTPMSISEFAILNWMFRNEQARLYPPWPSANTVSLVMVVNPMRLNFLKRRFARTSRGVGT